MRRGMTIQVASILTACRHFLLTVTTLAVLAAMFQSCDVSATMLSSFRRELGFRRHAQRIELPADAPEMQNIDRHLCPAG